MTAIIQINVTVETICAYDGRLFFLVMSFALVTVSPNAVAAGYISTLHRLSCFEVNDVIFLQDVPLSSIHNQF